MESFSVSQVFVPGKLPVHTYNPRNELDLEEKLHDYIDEAGAILTLAGPTKTGKTVLLKNVLKDPVWLDGQGLDHIGDFWNRVGDALGIYTQQQRNSGNMTEDSVMVQADVSVGFAKVGTGGAFKDGQNTGRTETVTRPVSVVATEALKASERALVVDDFHFVERSVQRDIIRALKPIVLAGLPVIFVSISHRVQEVVTAEQDMTGRVKTLQVDLWTEEDLLVIADKGFKVLNVKDPDQKLAKRLASASFGSPHLMQQFCRELCKANDVRQTRTISGNLQAPDSWKEFFQKQVEGASKEWGQRLIRGPQERGGSGRTKWKLKDGRELDGYGLTIAAVANTGPMLSLTRDEVKAAIDSIVDGAAPQANQTTRVLLHMSRIAARRKSEPTPTEEQLDIPVQTDDQDGENLPRQPLLVDVQPVLDYMEDGPNSTLHIADPFFAFYLACSVPDEEIQSIFRN